MSSLPLVNSLVRNRLFKTAPDIEESPFQYIHTVDLSAVGPMLHDNPDLVIHWSEIWAVWRSQLERKEVGVSWRSSSTAALAQCSVPVHWPAGTKSLPDTLRITDSSMTSLWRREAASKKSARDITIISCFVTTLKLPHALQIYLTVFVKKCTRLRFFKVCSNKLQVKWEIQLCICWQIISACNSERIIKIGQYFWKLCSYEKWSSFFLTHSISRTWQPALQSISQRNNFWTVVTFP